VSEFKGALEPPDFFPSLGENSIYIIDFFFFEIVADCGRIINNNTKGKLWKR
jgi:hypothetical protein